MRNEITQSEGYSRKLKQKCSLHKKKRDAIIHTKTPTQNKRSLRTKVKSAKVLGRQWLNASAAAFNAKVRLNASICMNIHTHIRCQTHVNRPSR